MQTDIFLKPLVADQDKTQKGSLVFCDVTCNPIIRVHSSVTKNATKCVYFCNKVKGQELL